MYVFIILGALISFFSSIYYTVAILRGQVKPNRVTWLIWGVAPLISAGAAFSTGVTWSALPVFMAGFGPTIVFVASFFNKASYWTISRFDYICGATSILALIAWYLTKDPDIAIFLAIISDLLAALPTLIKSWRFPETESTISFLGGIFSAATAFTAIEHWTFAELAFPSYLLLLNLVLTLAILLGKRTSHRR